ncbi:MAG: alpha/beta fold hydrolase, partial [Halobacteriaceae archaeon]
MSQNWQDLLEQETYVTVDGIETHHYDIGEGDPIVLVHGGGWTSCAENNWGAVILRLSERTRVVALDLPGFGFTPVRGSKDYKAKER